MVAIEWKVKWRHGGRRMKYEKGAVGERLLLYWYMNAIFFMYLLYPCATLADRRLFQLSSSVISIIILYTRSLRGRQSTFREFWWRLQRKSPLRIHEPRIKHSESLE
jgi:hypothetical protein